MSASLQQPFEPNAQNIKAASEQFVARGLDHFPIGSPYFFATLALDEALEALKEGNYGVGASGLIVRGENYYIFRQRNAMNTGIGVVDHAETRLVMDIRRFVLEVLDNRPILEDERARSELRQPYSAGMVSDLNLPTSSLENSDYLQSADAKSVRYGDGIYVFSNLEPCPMCMESIFNAGGLASITSSPDPFAADVISNPESRPPLWRIKAAERGLTYTLIDTPVDATAARLEEYRQFREEIVSGKRQLDLNFKSTQSVRMTLMYLSEEIFLTTREAIDAALTARS